MSAGSSLIADAREQGQGGKVIVWADDATRFAGTISARGGAARRRRRHWSRSRASRRSSSTAASTPAPRSAPPARCCSTRATSRSRPAPTPRSAPGRPSPAAPRRSTLNTTTLQTALATNNVIVDTTSAFASAGNIAVNNPVTWASGNSLELRAHNNITVAAAATINATGAGALRLIANQDASGGGDVSINAALTAHSGGIAISGHNIASVAAGTLTTTGLAGGDAGAVTHRRDGRGQPRRHDHRQRRRQPARAGRRPAAPAAP